MFAILYDDYYYICIHFEKMEKTKFENELSSACSILAYFCSALLFWRRKKIWKLNQNAFSFTSSVRLFYMVIQNGSFALLPVWSVIALHAGCSLRWDGESFYFHITHAMTIAYEHMYVYGIHRFIKFDMEKSQSIQFHGGLWPP